MPTIEDQLALEQNMSDRGAEAYLKNQRKAEEKGRGSELDYSRRLMQDYMQPLIEALRALVPELVEIVIERADVRVLQALQELARTLPRQ